MNRTTRYTVIAFAAALLLVPLVAMHAADAPKQTGTIRIAVDASMPQWQISRYLTGMHFVYGFEHDSLYRDEHIADWMRRAKVGIIRWPGGTAVQTHHWDRLNGISFKADTWDRVDCPVAYRTEANAHLLKPIDQRDQVAHRPPESIKSPDEQDVAAAKFLKTGIKPRSVVSRAGCLVGEDQFVGNTAFLQSI